MKSSKDPSCQGRRYRRYFAGSPAWGSVPISVALPNTAESTPYPRCRRRKCHRRTHHYALQVKRPIVGDRGIIDQNQLRLQSELGLDPVSRRYGNHTAADRPLQLLAAKSRRCTRSVADVRNRVGSNDRSSRSWSSRADPKHAFADGHSGHPNRVARVEPVCAAAVRLLSMTVARRALRRSALIRTDKLLLGSVSVLPRTSLEP